MGIRFDYFLLMICLMLWSIQGIAQGPQAGDECDGISSFFVGSIIPNPSFEDQSNCPSKASDLDYADSWEQATRATTDYFTIGCYMGEGIATPPTPFPDGKSCIGIVTAGLASTGSGDLFVYQEYLGTNLSSDLEKDTAYTLELYVGFGTPNNSTDPEDGLEGNIITPDEVALALYGYEGKASFPISTRECITKDYDDEWELLGTITVKSEGVGWVKTKFKFTPDVDYKAIIIGGECDIDTNRAPESEYIFIDNLILSKSSDFHYGTPTSIGSICNGDLKLIAPEVSINTIVLYQWYRDGEEVGNQSMSPELSLGNASGMSGNYYVVISDGKNCAKSESIYVDENNVFNIIPPGALCYDGVLILDAGSGYDSYLWNTGDTTQQITISEGGTYSVAVVKINGCDGRDTVVIAQPSKVEIVGNITNPDFQMNNGSIELTITGGQEPYTHLWSTGATERDIYNLSDGIYTVEVWDANSCAVTDTFTLSETPNKLNVIISVTPVLCAGENTGIIEIKVNGGVPPYEIEWPELEIKGEYTIDNLYAGDYKFIVTDNQGKKHQGSATISEPEPLLIHVVEEVDPSCFASANGSLEVKISGGEPPYSIHWNHSSSSDLSFDGLEAGTYIVIVSDNNHCEKREEINLSAPEALTADILIEDPSCYGMKNGFIHFSGLHGGVRPYTYFLNGEEVEPEVMNNLGKGDFLAQVIDDNGCDISVPFSLTEPDLIEVHVSADKNYVIEGESAILYLNVYPDFPEGFNYSWKQSGPKAQHVELCDTCATNVVSPRTSTRYTYIVENGKCSYSDDVVIDVEYIRLYMPNVFTPNNDGVNDKLVIGTNGRNLTVFSFEVYNRWGTLLYSEKNVPLAEFGGWDGKQNNQRVEPGTYLYRIDLVDNNGKHFKRKSTITVLE